MGDTTEYRYSTKIFALLLTSTYLFYAWILSTLTPTEGYDAFSYLWSAPLNRYFLTGRSLTQRTLYFLLQNNISLIVFAQLIIHGVLAFVLFLTFKTRTRHLLGNLLVLGCVIFFCSSFTFNVAAIYIGPEPIFIDLLLIFPCLIFGQLTKKNMLLILFCGTLLIFSKNIAPLACISMLAFRIITLYKKILNKQVLTYAALVILSILSLVITLSFDTSVNINTANNILSRILPNPILVRKFESQFGMPECSCTNTSSLSTVLDNFGGQPLLQINWRTRNYCLRNDHCGFSKWIRESGRKSYLNYLLSSPTQTLGTFRSSFHDSFTNGTLTTLSVTMLRLNRDSYKTSNFETIQSRLRKSNGKFFGVDSLVFLGAVLSKLGGANIYVVGALCLTALILNYINPKYKYFDLSSALLGSSLPLFFISYFGDGMEKWRHVLPITILSLFGVLTFIYACMSVLLKSGSSFKNYFTFVNTKT